MLKVVAGENDGYLHVQGAPFDGPYNGKDSHGHRFDRHKTDFMEDLIPLPPVFYMHGGMNSSDDESEGVFKKTTKTVAETIKRWVDDTAVWFGVQLDISTEIGSELWDYAKKGMLYASTGCVPASFDPSEIGPDGVIKSWLIGDLSLIPITGEKGKKPSNYYAVAKPAELLKFVKVENQAEFRQLLEKNDVEVEFLGGDPQSKEGVEGTKKEVEEINQGYIKMGLLGMIEDLTASIFSAISDGATMADVETLVGEAFVAFVETWEDEEEISDDMMNAAKSVSSSIVKNAFDLTDALKVAEEKATTELEKVQATKSETELVVEDLSKQVESLTTEIEDSKDEVWADAQIESGKLTPEEKPEILKSIKNEKAKDRQLAMLTKSAYTGDSVIKKSIEGRTPMQKEVRVIDFGQTSNTGDGKSDPAVVDKMMGGA